MEPSLSKSRADDLSKQMERLKQGAPSPRPSPRPSSTNSLRRRRQLKAISIVSSVIVGLGVAATAVWVVVERTELAAHIQGVDDYKTNEWYIVTTTGIRTGSETEGIVNLQIRGDAGNISLNIVGPLRERQISPIGKADIGNVETLRVKLLTETTDDWFIESITLINNRTKTQYSFIEHNWLGGNHNLVVILSDPIVSCTEKNSICERRTATTTTEPISHSTTTETTSNSSTTASKPTTTTTTASEITATATSTTTDGGSGGISLPLIVAGVALLLLLVGAGVYFYKRNKKKREAEDAERREMERERKQQELEKDERLKREAEKQKKTLAMEQNALRMEREKRRSGEQIMGAQIVALKKQQSELVERMKEAEAAKAEQEAQASSISGLTIQLAESVVEVVRETISNQTVGKSK